MTSQWFYWLLNGLYLTEAWKIVHAKKAMDSHLTWSLQGRVPDR